MTNWIKALMPKPVWRLLRRLRERWFDVYARKSYSQEGEDVILDRFIEDRPVGFYVDVGAHHPKRFSNTYRLYRKGWKGINIDATPGSMKPFHRLRPRDINIEAAISSVSEELTYYIFNEPALNTFSKDLAMQRVSDVYRIIEQVPIMTTLLGKLLDKHLPAGTRIDLLTIDVEGLDYDVLQSNDWDRYSFDFILVECFGAITLDQARSDSTTTLLVEKNYSIVAKTMNTLLFARNSLYGDL